jgi:hypothetical protein
VAHSEREHPRYAHEAAVTLRVGGRQLSGRTTNVSRGGFCADLEVEIPIGTEVEVDLHLVFEDDVHSDALRMAARVVWCTTVDEGFQIGLAFKPLNAEKTKYLTLFLRYLDDNVKTPKGRASDRNIDDRFG